LTPLCVLAGENVHYTVYASDTDRDYVYLYASGGPLTYEPNTCAFTYPSGNGYYNVTGNLNWATACNDVRKQPYQFSFYANDDDRGSGDAVPCILTAFENVSVTVVAPPPLNPAATAIGNNIFVTWNQSPCPQATGYKIYRRNGLYSGVIQCPCTTGVPTNTGFALIATVQGLDSLTFSDSNNGLGLSHGIDYCYMITAIFADGSESCASVQACAELKKDSPILTNVSVVTTDITNGAMYIAWSAPTQLDTSQYRGPYVYKIYRSSDFAGSNMQYVDATPSSINLNDTIYHDNIVLNGSFNTQDYPWSYRIDLYSHDTLVDKSQVASSVYLKLSPTNHTINLSWSENVPWLDTAFDIYRLNHFTANWDFIAHTTSNTFSNPGLANDTVYCYYVRSEGYYSQPGFVVPDTNLSQRNCVAAKDNVFPCAPNLTINANCIAHVDSLIWNNPNYTCASGVIEYKVYIDTNYSADTSTFKLLATITNLSDTTFIYNNPYSIAGCFKVTALDTILNETQIANTVCVDNCPDYTLPNVFTPNGDGLNDFFHPFPYSFVKDIDIEIFDRWGIKMFSTTNPDINWDGTNQSTKGLCPDGVYYYICKVHAIHYNGIKTFTLKGNIELIREKK
jgi:gliding motility-associated-like protein